MQKASNLYQKRKRCHWKIKKASKAKVERMKEIHFQMKKKIKTQFKRVKIIKNKKQKW